MEERKKITQHAHTKHTHTHLALQRTHATNSRYLQYKLLYTTILYNISFLAYKLDYNFVLHRRFWFLRGGK